MSLITLVFSFRDHKNSIRSKNMKENKANWSLSKIAFIYACCVFKFTFKVRKKTGSLIKISTFYGKSQKLLMKNYFSE